MRLSAPIAYISAQRGLSVVDRAGRHRAQSDASAPALLWGDWGSRSPQAGAWSWPTWSSDGRRLACFRLPDGESSSSRLFAFDVDGVSAIALADLDERLPIYIHWSPDDAWVAVLAQVGDRLALSVADASSTAPERRIVEGSPLFFTWADDRLATFVGPRGSPGGARVSLVDPVDGFEHARLPGTPGNFCTPVVLDGLVVYVATDEGASTLVAAPLDGGGPALVLDQTRGLVAMVGAPDGRRVARAVAVGGDGTPYHDLTVIDAFSGERRPLGGEPVLAFLWCTGSDALVTVRVDTDRNLLLWHRVDLDGHATLLAEMYPTRDLGFYLRFFEQYASSHPLLDPNTLLVSGGLQGHGDPHGTPRLWCIPLDGGPPEDIGAGLFAVFGPRNSPI